ncbi:MAG: polysaccharide biosynthesis/export family protein [Pseudomonadota bacterium]
MRIALLFLIVLSACNFDTAQKKNPPAVQVIEVDFALVEKLNADQYRPKNLPAALRNVASAHLPPKPRTQHMAKIAPILPPAQKRSEYRLGPTDMVTLSSPNAPEDVQVQGLLDAKARREVYQVREDGTISVPGLSPVPVAGLTLKDAEEAVFDALITQNLEPNLSFEVTGYHSQTASISGAVAAPVIASISSKPLYLDQALQMAGGIRSGDPDRTIVRIYRAGQTYHLSARDALSQTYGRVRLVNADNVVVEALDGGVDPARQQAVGEATTAFQIRAAQLEAAKENFQNQLALGAIKRDRAYLVVDDAKPAAFDLPFEARAVVADALSTLDSEDDLRHVYILRGQQKTQNAYHLDLRIPGNLRLTTRLELRPNDLILISKSLIRTWDKKPALGL